MTATDLAELRERRGAAADRASMLNDRCVRESRDFHPDERKQYEAFEAEMDKLGDQIEELERRQDGRRPRLPAGILEEVPLSRPASRASLSLGREQRMSDWARSRTPQSQFSDDEAREFSMGRAIRGMMSGNWQDADLERRALAEGATATGGALVPTPMASYAIDRLRNRARVVEAGATIVPMESDTLSIPRLATGVSGTWKPENAPVTVSDPTFERVTLNTHTLATSVVISYELAEDMTSAGADAINRELDQALALELDRVALRGSGVAEEPLGIRNQPGVVVQSLGANGLTPADYSLLINSDYQLDQSNVEANAAIMNPRTAKTFASLKDTTNQPLIPPPALSDLKLLTTNQIPVNLTQGTATNASEVYTADWSQLLIGVRPSLGVRLIKDSHRLVDQLSVLLVAWLRADIQIAHPSGFVVTTGLLP